MKLYTREQMIEAFQYGKSLNGFDWIGDMIDSLDSIELPSDEEIEDKGKWVFNNAGHTIFTHYNTVPSWVEGAKWMRDKILNK